MKDNSLHAYLATCDGDQPTARPVSPIVEDDMMIRITTSAASRKVKQMERNPKVCLTFAEHPNGEKAATVIGEARIISDMEQKKRVWGLASFDLAQHFPGGPGSADFCLLKIIVRRIEWRDSWTGEPKVYERKAE